MHLRVRRVGGQSTAVRFNALINARDAAGLAALMTEDHAFVDTEGHAVRGRAACLEAWRGFFDTFPTYRNEFTSGTARDGLVVMTGRSVCTDHADLDGPALWTARVVGGSVSEWRVYEDTGRVRRRLGVPDRIGRPAVSVPRYARRPVEGAPP